MRMVSKNVDYCWNGGEIFRVIIEAYLQRSQKIRKVERTMKTSMKKKTRRLNMFKRLTK